MLENVNIRIIFKLKTIPCIITIYDHNHKSLFPLFCPCCLLIWSYTHITSWASRQHMRPCFCQSCCPVACVFIQGSFSFLWTYHGSNLLPPDPQNVKTLQVWGWCMGLYIYLPYLTFCPNPSFFISIFLLGIDGFHKNISHNCLFKGDIEY